MLGTRSSASLLRHQRSANGCQMQGPPAGQRRCLRWGGGPVAGVVGPASSAPQSVGRVVQESAGRRPRPLVLTPDDELLPRPPVVALWSLPQDRGPAVRSGVRGELGYWCLGLSAALQSGVLWMSDAEAFKHPMPSSISQNCNPASRHSLAKLIRSLGPG